MANQQDLDKYGIKLITQKDAPGRLFAYTPSNNAIGMGGPDQVHEILDPQSVQGFSFTDLDALPRTQGGQQNFLYGKASGANMNWADFEKNVLGGYASNSALKSSQDTALAKSNEALGANAFTGKPSDFATPTPQQTVIPQLGTKEYTDYLIERARNLGVQIPAQFEKGTTDISKRFQEGAQAAKEAGVQSPSNYEGANSMFNSFLSPQQPPSAIDNFVSQDPYLNSVVGAFQQYMSQQNQRTSLVQEYQNLLKSSGIEGIDTELINMKKVIEGTEDDIRNEVTKAGGFATDSQVMALSNARNKQLIKNYNTLLETRNSKERYLDTVMNLTGQDRLEADKKFETMTNFGLKISEINQTMKKNAIDTLDRTAKTLGWDGILNATQGNPQLQRQIEMMYGLPPGGLAIAAQRDMDARKFAKEEKELGLQEKKLGISLKSEQIKTEQAQRAKTIAETQKIIKEQKGSILDPTTPEGAKQLSTMKSQVDLIQGLLTDKNLRGTVGPIPITRFSLNLGGKANFIAGIEQLRSGLNLQSLIDAKSKGATFGALSDQELQVLANAATKIGYWAVKDKKGNTIGYAANQKDFKKELDKINNFAKLDYIYRGGNPEDVGVQVINGKYYTKNSDGSVTEL